MKNLGCKLCWSLGHTTEWHTAKMVKVRVKSKLWQERVAESNRLNKSGKPSWNKGLKGSVPGRSSDPEIEQERKRKISEHHKGRRQPWCTGSRHWRWKGGRPQKYGSRFRRARPKVLARDKRRCVMCGAKQMLRVHHIDHKAWHNQMSNLVTLCHPDNVRAESKRNYLGWQKWLTIYTQEVAA